MRVLVIPEDFRKDRYILQPMIEAMLKQLGRKQATVRVCTDPLLGGIGQALNWERIDEIIDLYKGMIDVFLLCVDRDGETGRRVSLDGIETKSKGALRTDQLFLAENAWQEIEVWVLAGLDLPPGWNWKDIRSEVDSKEKYFYPYAKRRNLMNEPGEGRKTLAVEASRNYARVRTLCPEDVASLETRVRQWLTQKL